MDIFDALERACQAQDAEATTLLLEGLLVDLAAARDNATRLQILERLEAALRIPASENADRARLARLAEGMETQSWNWLIRGTHAAIIGKYLGGEPGRVASILERAGLGLVRAWEQVRLDHMGCLLPIIMMTGGVQLLNLALDWLLGPAGELGWVPMALFLGWLVFGILTVETHFTGHETLGYRFVVALGYFGLLSGGLLSAVLVRLG